MKLTHYLYIAAMGALFTACNDEENMAPAYTVGEADNLITLRAGIGEAGSGVVSRATDTNHDNHLALTQGTQAALRMDGTWTGKGTGTVSQTTTATVGTATDKHNSLGLSPQLYWDEYGTADPANTAGRNEGLTIYGAAVDGETTAPTISSWTDQTWTLDADQKTNDWKKKDLLTSNNIKDGNDGTLQFDEWKNNSSSDLLVFTHAMSKITVNLKAGEGFTNSAFAADPTVEVQGTYLSGSVNIKNATTAADNTGTKTVITLKKDATTTANYTATYCGLLMPGNSFANADNILRINADGNIYYVTAEKINNVNTEANDKFERGKNYILNVTLNKTGIKVSATITNWVDVNAEEVAPLINVGAVWGEKDNGSNTDFNSFSFYRSTTFDKGYSENYSGNDNNYFAPEAVAQKPANADDQWIFQAGGSNVKLYWPNHNTHYQFRGVWPETSVLTTDTETVPHVYEADNVQKINIKNVAYSTTANYPSNLMIGRPEVTGNCDNSETSHTQTDLSTGGICATEGKITLNFRYVMSQVEVVLTTTDPSSTDHVNIGANTKVEIINVANDGYVKLGDRAVVPSTTTSSYTLDQVSGTGNELKRHSAIVPQTLTFTQAGASTNVRFKITVTNTDNSQDIYYADIQPIKESGKQTLIAPNNKWESGVHYIYKLKLSKTEIKATATITDWITKEADTEIWM